MLAYTDSLYIDIADSALNGIAVHDANDDSHGITERFNEREKQFVAIEQELATKRGYNDPDILAKADVAGTEFTGKVVSRALVEHLVIDGVGTRRSIFGATEDSKRWAFTLADDVPESGDNAGSNIRISRYDNDGQFLGTPMAVKRSDGSVQIYKLRTGDGQSYDAPGMNIYWKAIEPSINLTLGGVWLIKDSLFSDPVMLTNTAYYEYSESTEDVPPTVPSTKIYGARAVNMIAVSDTLAVVAWMQRVNGPLQPQPKQYMHFALVDNSGEDPVILDRYTHAFDQADHPNPRPITGNNALDPDEVWDMQAVKIEDGTNDALLVLEYWTNQAFSLAQPVDNGFSGPGGLGMSVMWRVGVLNNKLDFKYVKHNGNPYQLTAADQSYSWNGGKWVYSAIGDRLVRVAPLYAQLGTGTSRYWLNAWSFDAATGTSQQVGSRYTFTGTTTKSDFAYVLGVVMEPNSSNGVAIVSSGYNATMSYIKFDSLTGAIPVNWYQVVPSNFPTYREDTNYRKLNSNSYSANSSYIRASFARGTNTTLLMQAGTLSAGTEPAEFTRFIGGHNFILKANVVSGSLQAIMLSTSFSNFRPSVFNNTLLPNGKMYFRQQNKNAAIYVDGNGEIGFVTPGVDSDGIAGIFVEHGLQPINTANYMYCPSTPTTISRTSKAWNSPYVKNLGENGTYVTTHGRIHAVPVGGGTLVALTTDFYPEQESAANGAKHLLLTKIYGE
jgi:hypothetical protein